MRDAIPVRKSSSFICASTTTPSALTMPASIPSCALLVDRLLSFHFPSPFFLLGFVWERRRASVFRFSPQHNNHHQTRHRLHRRDGRGSSPSPFSRSLRHFSTPHRTALLSLTPSSRLDVKKGITNNRRSRCALYAYRPQIELLQVPPTHIVHGCRPRLKLVAFIVLRPRRCNQSSVS